MNVRHLSVAFTIAGIVGAVAMTSPAEADVIGSIGGACPGAGFACTPDMRSALACVGGKFVLAETCKGPGACKVAPGATGGPDIFCDNDISDIGDPCRDDGDYACTGDKIAALRCVGRRMVEINTCRGPKSCSVVHKGKEVDIDCDMSIAAENDPCAFAGNEACTVGGKGMLTCVGGRYTAPRACPGPGGCTVTATAKTFKVSCR